MLTQSTLLQGKRSKRALEQFSRRAARAQHLLQLVLRPPVHHENPEHGRRPQEGPEQHHLRQEHRESPEQSENSRC